MKTIYVKIFLIHVLLWSQTLQAQTYSFLKEISGFTQTPPLAALSGPFDLTTDIQGNLYVTVREQNAVYKYNSSGAFIQKWYSGDPIAITSDALGNIYVSNTTTMQIHKYSSSGQLILSWGGSGTANGQFSFLRGLAVDAQNNIYAVDQSNNRVQKFSSTGVFITAWGTLGTANGQFNTPLVIDVDASGNVYVGENSTTAATRIQKFTSSGAFLTKFSTGGSGDGQFNQYGGIGVDLNAGNVYVSDWGGNRIQKFSSSGAFISKWGSFGSGDGQFNYPGGTHVDNQGNVYVVDVQNNRIQKFNSNGGFISKIAPSSSAGGQLLSPLDMLSDASGNLLVADTFNNRLQKFNASGAFVEIWGSYGSADGQLILPANLARDSFGNIYVTDVGNNRIQKFSSTGVFISKWGTAGTGDGQFNKPFGLAIDASNNVYVGDAINGRIQKFSSTGVFITKWGSIGNGDGQFGGDTDWGMSGMALDPSGNLYVMDRYNSRVQKFSSNGTFITKWGTYGPGNGQFEGPFGLDVDAAGQVFVIDGANNRVQKFSSTGTYLTQFGSMGYGNGQFINPLAISVDASGKVYVSEEQRIQVFTPPSSILSNVNTDAPYCQGQTIAVTYMALSTFTTGNAFVVQLSDASGSFISPTVIGSFAGTTSGVINATIPSNTPVGAGYRVRIVGTVPFLTGSDNGTNISINAKPITSIITGPATVCANQVNVAYNVDFHTGSAYNWTLPSGATKSVGNGNAIQVNFANNSGSISVVETNATCAGNVITLPVQVNPLPNSNLIVDGPTVVCAQEQGLLFKVNNATTGATYNWTLPTGATITANAGSSQITLKWGNVSGNVTISETNSCGTGATSYFPVATKAKYALGDVSVVCGSSFCLPIQTVGNINAGLIGLDYVINYDAALLTPSTSATVGPVATSYGDYRINTATPGKVFVSVFLKNAPSNTFFSGSGTVLCVNFTAKAVGANTSQLTTDAVEESSLISSAVVCPAIPSAINITGVVGGRILYRASTNNQLAYSVSNPSLYLPTNVTGYGATCTLVPGSAVLPNTSGVFAFNPDSCPLLKLERDIKGDLNIPTIACSNIQAVINSSDWALAAAIANYSNTTPSIYQLLSADVNLDGKVTSGDVSLISSRSINANNCEFPQAWNYQWNGTTYVTKTPYVASKDWLFLDDATLSSTEFTSGFSRNYVPQAPVCLAAPTGIANCTPVVTATYHAILLGDINGNWLKANDAAQARESIAAEIFFDLPNAIVNGPSKTIPIYYAGVSSFSGIDFSIDYTSDVTITSVSGANGIAVQWNNIANQRLMVSAYANEKLTGNYPVLYLTVTTKEELTTQSFSVAAGYLNGEQANMRFDESNVANGSSGIYAEISPNPSNGITYLYATDAAAFVKVSIYQTDGTLVYENINVAANENAALPELKAGVYIVKVSGSSGETTKKLVRY